MLPTYTVPSWSIAGDEITGEPLSGVEVSLGGCPGAVGLTRENGSFTILDVPPGVYTLEYVKEGYEDRQDPATVNSDLNVNATLIPLILPPSNATITGKVTDMNTGDPVAGATIALDGLTDITASNGTFSFSVEMGSYTMSVDKIGYEINFTKYFYEFKPLRSLAEIKADILALEESTVELEKRVLEE